MDFPKRHDLACYDEDFEFERSGFCSQQWLISVRQKFNIIWSIVLSYLKSAEFKFPDQFEERLNQLTNGKVNTELAKTAISNFNPFFNIHKCFFDETLKKICTYFRNILNEKRGKRKQEVAPDLQMISSLLEIKILIINLKDKKLHVVLPKSVSSGNVAHITLFVKLHITEANNEVKRFHFGLDDDLCRKLRKQALEIILETSEFKKKVEEEIHLMLDRGEKNINFLITLLKKHPVFPVSSLYDSSYIAGKLSNAGFETDPTVLDPQGFSAFYYALQSNDRNLVYILYRYAANSCYISENTVREPSSSIISKLEQILKGDCVGSENFKKCGDRSEPARLNYHDLMRFSEFLTQISDGIHDIRERPETNDIEKAAKLKDIILHILNTYVSKRFFSIGELDECIAENYNKHKTYYDNLDSIVALLFFDNIFLLKSVLETSHPRLYSELESFFLLSALTSKYFTKNIVRIQESGFELDTINFPLFERLNLREEVIKFCKILTEEKLDKTRIVKCIKHEEIKRMLSNFPELIDEFSISRLERYLKPLETVSEGLKQKLVIQRALHVIGEEIKVNEEDSSTIKVDEAAYLPINVKEEDPSSINADKVGHLSINVENEDPSFINCDKVGHSSLNVKEKGFASINAEEKGSEFITIEKEGISSINFKEDASVMNVEEEDSAFITIEEIDRSCIKQLLQKCLTKMSVDDLKKARNMLSKLKSFQFSLKFDLEQDDDLFTSIQCEITIIKKKFKEAFEIHRVQFEEFLFNRAVENIKKYEGRVHCLENVKAGLLRKIRDQKKKDHELHCILEQKKTNEHTTLVPNIKEFCRRLTVDKDGSRNEDEQLIRGEMPAEFEIHGDAIERLKQDLENALPVDVKIFDDLILNKNDITNAYEKYLEEKAEKQKSYNKSFLLKKIRNTPNPAKTLDLICKKKKVSKFQLRALKGMITFSSKAITALNSLTENSKEQSCGDNLSNLLNRIKYLHQIAIDEQYDISYLWERAKSTKAKQHIVYKIVQRYFRDSAFQASLEMLLFDCFQILKTKEENPKDVKNNEQESVKCKKKVETNINEKVCGKNIPGKNEENKLEKNDVEESNHEKKGNEELFNFKTSYLFNGINVRNVLAHGDALFESIGNILDPKDFPSELGTKLLQLLEDRKCIESLCELWKKVQQSDKIPENCPEFHKLRERIILCDRWQGYCKLLAEDPKKDKAFNVIVLFLKSQKER